MADFFCKIVIVLSLASFAACSSDGSVPQASKAFEADSLRQRSDSLVEAARHVPPHRYKPYFEEALRLRRKAAALSGQAADSAAVGYLESRIQMLDTLYKYQIDL